MIDKWQLTSDMHLVHRLLVTVPCSFALAVGLVLAVVGDISAQGQKEQAPATRLSTLPDSLASLTQETRAIRRGKPQLELPEVLVYGKGESLRRVGVKASARDLPVLVRSISVQRRNLKFGRPSVKERPVLSEQLSSAILQVLLAGGSYETLDSRVLLGQDLGRLTYRVAGGYDRSAGQYEDSQYKMLDTKARLGYSLSSKSVVSVQGDFGRNDYGLHGASYDGSSRQVDALHLGSSLEASVSSASALTASYDVSLLDMKTDTVGQLFRELEGESYKLSASFATSLSGLDLVVKGGTFSESVKLPDSSTTSDNSISELDLGARFGISRSADVSLGLKVQDVSFPTDSSKTCLAPYGRLFLNASDRLGFNLSVQTGYYYEPFEARLAENPYVDEAVTLFPTRTKLALKLGGELAMYSGLKVGVEFQRDWLEDFWYWQRDATHGLFLAHVLPEARVSRVTITLTGSPVTGLYLDGRFVLLMDSFDHDGVSEFVKDIPYRPGIRLPLTLAYWFDKNTKLDITADWIGSRVSSLESQDKLASHVVVNASVTRKFGRHFSVFVRGINLTTQEYVWWQEYPEMRARILLGAGATF